LLKLTQRARENTKTTPEVTSPIIFKRVLFSDDINKIKRHPPKGKKIKKLSIELTLKTR
jgi:hypothetical protein